MRTVADLQRAPGKAPAAGPPGLPLDVQRVRTFDTPEFAGMSFLEVETKSALNKVHGMPFGWSINPYRGCSHACSYCLSGETPILMADGRTRRLRDVRVGDRVFGTRRHGRYRRYVATDVLDHWSTVKPAYRVALSDGTELVASADHRFLARRGWKHVTGGQQGAARRPRLKPGDELVGTGRFAMPPKPTAEYQRAYLCGVVRGGGLAGTCGGALARAHRYLSEQGLAAGAVRGLLAWPIAPAGDWAKGFLAGIHDARGSAGRALRISSTDEETARQVCAALRLLDFPHTVEPRTGGGRSIRVRGGLRERLRFLHTVEPATSREEAISGSTVRSPAPLRVVAVEPLGVELPLYDITTGTGDFIADGVVSHNCFARPSHAYLNLSPGADFEKTVVVKTNLVEVLRRELARPSWRGESVAMGTNTDPYQRCEGRYRLMPGVIDALAEFLTPFSILTKGTLVTRDVDRLVAAAERVDVGAAFTVGMLDEALWRASEPGTPSPRARLDAVRRLNEAGIPTGIMLAPIMPGLNDDRDQLAALVDAAAAAGAVHITPIVLHLRRGPPGGARAAASGRKPPPAWKNVRDVFMPWLAEHHPGLVGRYEQLYRGAYADKGYREEIERFVAERRRVAWRRHGRPAPRDARPRGRPAARRPGPAGVTPTPEGEQLRLW